MYIPLHITTDYSLLSSAINIDTLLAFLEKNKLDTCAICDINLFGVMDFYTKMKKHGYNPIVGLEVIITEYPIYLYAKNEEGYHTLLKLHTLMQEHALSLFDLEKEHLGLLAILPFESFSLYKEMKEIIDCFLGYKSDAEKRQALILCEDIVYVSDVRAFTKEDVTSLEILSCIKEGKSKKDCKDSFLQYLLEDPKYLTEEDILSTKKFSDLCHLTLTTDKNYIPHFDESIRDSYSYLCGLSKKGLLKRFHGTVSKEYINRLEYELSVIASMGFVDYFLIVYDYVKYAKTHDIYVGAGRGSAVGSLVCYSIGITDIDPLKYGLLFERFLNPGRITMPDIDIDFENTKRDEVISYVIHRYKEKHVAPILTFGTLGTKQSLLDVGKVLEVEPNLLKRFVSLFDPKLSLKENMQNENIKYQMAHHIELREVVAQAIKIEGMKRQTSTHAAGVVISSAQLDEVIPLYKNEETYLTGVTMDYLEDLGLLKMDFLALKNLSILHETVNLIEKYTGKKIQVQQIPLDDKEIYERFRTADTIGIFQFESAGLRSFLKQLQPRSFEDLVAALALFRPGPMQNIPSFIKRREGKEKIDYYHPTLEPILKETYGIIVYQEQVMQILVTMGGYTFSEADLVRRAMSKKKVEVMEKERAHFISNAVNKGYSKELAEQVFEMISYFAGYGFNKSHAVSYAYIGYQMAYLKEKYFIYYMANLLNMSIGSEIKIKEYVLEARKGNISVLKPEINQSRDTFEVEEESLLMPFGVIKNLGESAIRAITEERDSHGPFKDFLDFVRRSYSKSVTSKTIESLIMADVFRNFGINQNTLLNNMELAINYATLASGLDDSFLLKPNLVEYESEDEVILREREFTSYGFYVSNHPASKYQGNWLIKIENMSKYFDQYVTLVVLVERIKRINTKNGETMAFVDGTDETGLGNFVVFAKGYAALEGILPKDLIQVRGRVTKRFDKYQVNVNQIVKIDK